MNVDVIRAAKILVRDPEQVEGTAREVTRILRERHRRAEGQPSDFTLVTSSAIQQTVGTVQRVLFLYLPLVAGVSLLAGGAVAQRCVVVGERAGARSACGARWAHVPATSASSS
jgi:hypothetical protein